jgi:hypothetical protein
MTHRVSADKANSPPAARTERLDAMRSLGLALCLATGVTAGLGGQPPDPKTRAAAWFSDDGATHIARGQHLARVDWGEFELVFEAMARAVPAARKGDIGIAGVRFQPIWTPSHSLNVAITSRLARRLAQLPPHVVRRWAGASALDEIRAALSLAAENGLFPDETFSPVALDRLLGTSR